MDWRSPNRTTRKPPPGEYVVFHERPFPEKLDRVFRQGAVVLAIFTAIGLTSVTVATADRAPSNFEGQMALAIALVLIVAMAYGFVRAIGLMTVSLVQTFRRKRYVVDWQEDPAKRR